MTAYPKHYLTDVPHELRRKLLDLCILRRYHEAYDLLQASGFTRYEPYELVWFHDWAPTTLPQTAAPDPATPSESTAALSDSQTLTAGVTPTAVTAPNSPSLQTQTHRSSNPVIREAPSLPAAPNLNTTDSAFAVKVPKRRSKVARLPEPVRQNLNAGSSYSQIIAWLNAHGHRGFNKVNLHNWRCGGFQDWLRDQADSTGKNLNNA